MDTETLRRTGQVTFATIAVVAAALALLRFLGRGGPESLFGERVVAEPDRGPVGMRPFIDLRGYPRGHRLTVYLCVGSTSEIGDCAKLASGRAPGPLRSRAIPREFPDANEVSNGSYVLRAGPDDQGQFPVRGNFTVAAFKVGRHQRPRSFGTVDPSSLELGRPRVVVRGAPCRPPIFLADGRLSVGSTVLDPQNNVTIEFPFQAAEMTWSAVGDKLAYLTTDRKEIRLAAADGSGAVTVVREARGLLSSLSWSPEGDHLAFISRNDPAVPRLGPGPPTVKILNAINGRQSAAGPGLAVSWSFKGDTLTIDRAGGRIELGTPDGKRRAYGPGRLASFSWDGSYLTFVRRGITGGVDEGWIGQLNGRIKSPVVPGRVCAISFSPSGSTLAVVRERGNSTSLELRSIGTKS